MNLTRRALAWMPLVVGAFGTSAKAETAKAPAARGYANGPFGLIHYRDTGKGEPLILLHQAPMSSQQFETVYPLFAASTCRASVCPTRRRSNPLRTIGRRSCRR